MNLPIPTEMLEKAHRMLAALPEGSLPLVERLVEAGAKLAEHDSEAAKELLQDAERAANAAIAKRNVHRDRG